MFTSIPSPSWIRCPGCRAKLGEYIGGLACSEAHIRGAQKRVLEDVGRIICEKCGAAWQNPDRLHPERHPRQAGAKPSAPYTTVHE